MGELALRARELRAQLRRLRCARTRRAVALLERARRASEIGRELLLPALRALELQGELAARLLRAGELVLLRPRQAAELVALPLERRALARSLAALAVELGLELASPALAGAGTSSGTFTAGASGPPATTDLHTKGASASNASAPMPRASRTDERESPASAAPSSGRASSARRKERALAGRAAASRASAESRSSLAGAERLAVAAWALLPAQFEASLSSRLPVKHSASSEARASRSRSALGRSPRSASMPARRSRTPIPKGFSSVQGTRAASPTSSGASAP
jgi:hypothetical protein